MVRLMVNMLLGLLFWFPALAIAAGQQEFTVVIKDHQFIPVELKVPAGQKIKLIIDNQDPTPEEFESHELNREKIIGGNKKGIVHIGPLKAGSYAYVGEFHEKTAQGVIVAE